MYTKSISGFKLYTKKPNAIEFGSLYIKKIYIPFSEEKSRYLRVWLPSDYDGSKSYGVIYMSDGQNIVDRYTSLFGEWDMERHIENLQKEGHEGYIIVGIDSPHDYRKRMEEYSPYKIDAKKGDNHSYDNYGAYGDIFAEFIVNKIKPLIDKYFKTRPDLTGFCGSSMGGLFSFYICTRYPNIFKFSLCFSSAFMLYKKRHFVKQLKKVKFTPECYPKYYIYSGSKDKYESQFVKLSVYLYKYLIKCGYSSSNVMLVIDKTAEHNESYWSNHVLEALHFIIELLQPSLLSLEVGDS